MIGYNDIKNAVAIKIVGAFKDAEVSDDALSHVYGNAFIVKCTDMDFELFEELTARRMLHFDVVYFAPLDMPMHQVDTIGQELATAFMTPVHFSDRYIQPVNVATTKVDNDFHVEFDLEFFDAIDDGVEYEYADELNFRIELDI